MKQLSIFSVILATGFIQGCAMTEPPKNFGIKNCTPKFVKPARVGTLVTLTGGLAETFSETVANDHRYGTDEKRDWQCESPMMRDKRIMEMLDRIGRRSNAVDQKPPLN